jgi:hypothetical protein
MDLCWIIFLFSDLISDETLIVLHIDEMEEAPNKRNALASLTEDVIFEILHHLPACSLFCCKCVCRSWKNLISDPNNHKNLLTFNIDNVAVLDCCNNLILCWCLRADGHCYVVCNPMTQKFKILPPSTHVVGHVVDEARLGFDLTASSHFHVIEYVDVNAECAGVEIYSSQTTAWIYKGSE